MRPDTLAAARAAGPTLPRVPKALTPLQLERVRAVGRKLTPAVLAKAEAMRATLAKLPPGTVLVGPAGMSFPEARRLAAEGARVLRAAPRIIMAGPIPLTA